MAKTGGRSAAPGDDREVEEPRAESYGPEERAADRRLGAEVTQRRADQSRPDDGRGAAGGRGVAPSFDREPYPAVYGPPYRVNLKRALRAYRLGHDRGIEAERKLELAERGDEAWDRAERFRGPPVAGEVDPDSVADASAGHPEAVEEDAPESLVRHARFGVPVPERFSFHRGPDVWRDRKAARRERVSWPPEDAAAAGSHGAPPDAPAHRDGPADRREG